MNPMPSPLVVPFDGVGFPFVIVGDFGTGSSTDVSCCSAFCSALRGRAGTERSTPGAVAVKLVSLLKKATNYETSRIRSG